MHTKKLFCHFTLLILNSSHNEGQLSICIHNSLYPTDSFGQPLLIIFASEYCLADILTPCWSVKHFILFHMWVKRNYLHKDRISFLGHTTHIRGLWYQRRLVKAVLIIAPNTWGWPMWINRLFLFVVVPQARFLLWVLWRHLGFEFYIWSFKKCSFYIVTVGNTSFTAYCVLSTPPKQPVPQYQLSNT